jgi:phosphohistidine swiveling domain-containing protein
MILTLEDSFQKIAQAGGGKAKNLKKMQLDGAPVPEFIVISNDFFQEALKSLDLFGNIANLSDPEEIHEIVEKRLENYSFTPEQRNKLSEVLEAQGLLNKYLAVRSSGLDEDSKDHSFAGMFESFLFQKGIENIEKSIIQCWKSAFSLRCLKYRIENRLSITQLGMGVVIQKMVNSEISGVMFSRNPIDTVDRKNIVIEAVFGQCEGLVSGALESDSYLFHRETSEIKEKIVEKEFKFIQKQDAPGIDKIEINSSEQTLNEAQIIKLKDLAIKLEDINQIPLDIEWAIEGENLYVVQMRPVTTLPGLAYYNKSINGDYATLWDNSNIVESFAGVTTPLTFSLTKEAYAIVYRQTCRVLKVPESIIKEYDYAFTNMLGFIRGRVYYNLINWYKLLFIVPGSASNQGFMETMMGVKEELDDEQQELFNFVDEAPKYSAFRKLAVLGNLFWKFITIKSVTKEFRDNFDKIYTEYLAIDFKNKDLREIKRLYERWNEKVTYSWKAPIINDFLVMIFFGTLKKLCEKWIPNSDETFNIQNDLLCGQGDVDSTLPTITLMQLSKKYDENSQYQKLFSESSSEKLIQLYRDHELPSEITKDIDEYLKNYGFRCNNEQKLEEDDLYTNPSFIFDNLRNYIKMKNYSIDKMYENERKIRDKAQTVVNKEISGAKKLLFNWVLKHARAAVKNRENLRFLRSKSFGISRRIFRAMAYHLHQLDVVETENDTFYLTYREIFDFIDGKSEFLNLKDVAKIRREEFQVYLNEQDPPDRFLSYGTNGVSLSNIQIIQSGDLLKHKVRVSDDPDLFYGISCSPGAIQGKVRVAHSIDDAKDMNGEILVTKRTDPGWVPLFPFCGGLIIERGSLLSHSAVIARELGIPTIVGVPANLLETLETGMTVDLNATQAQVRIIHES